MIFALESSVFFHSPQAIDYHKNLLELAFFHGVP